MPVNIVLRRKDGCLVGGVRMDVKDAGFLVINPDDGMRRHARIVR
jgi:hypothetical protein